MIELIAAVTTVFLFMPVYVYLGYPCVLIVLSIFSKDKPVNKGEITPNVTMIVSCHNEFEIIEQKILNCLSLEYPEDKLQILFVSDASSDGTEETIGKYDGVTLIRQKSRLGKTMGLNLGVAAASGEILVFSDANAMYDANAIRMLVRNFNDEKVGYVVGAALYKDAVESQAGKSENTYWQYELSLKRLESQVSSVVGGDGAIYAIRADLYTALDPEDISDFVNPLQIIAKGYRGIFDGDAVCFEETAGDFNKEAKRKRRIVNRSFTALMKQKKLLNPFRYGLFSVQLISHKLLRWIIPVFIVLSAMGIVVLGSMRVLVFQIGVLLGIIFVWSVAFGHIFHEHRKISPILLYPYYFYLINLNSLLGVIDALRGNVQITWETPRNTKGLSKSDLPISHLFTFVIVLVTSWLFVQTLISIYVTHGTA